MAFSDNFTGADGTGLGTRTGWTQLQGTADELIIDGATGRLKRSSIAGGKLFYATADDGATSQSVTVDILQSFNPGPVIFGSVIGGNLNGYALNSLSATSVRLYRLVNGTTTSLVASISVPSANGVTLSGSVNGSGNVDLVVSQGGVTRGTFTDSSASKLTSGRRGLTPSVSSATSGTAMFDNYSDDSSTGVAGSVAGTLGLTGSAVATVKIAATGTGSLAVTGSSAGSVKAAGAASGSLGLSGSAQGSIAAHGAAAGLLGLSGTATAFIVAAGLASGSLDLSGSAGATAIIGGTAEGLIDLAGNADGQIIALPPIQGAANDNLTLTGSASALVGMKAIAPTDRIGTVERFGRTGTVAAESRVGIVTRPRRVA